MPTLLFSVSMLFSSGERGSLVVKALSYNRKVAGSTPDEVNF
jgi:hypothetical protein